jgi:hypothetical protein
MHPNPYESPQQATEPAEKQPNRHPLQRIGLILLVVVGLMLLIGVVHAMYVQLFWLGR